VRASADAAVPKLRVSSSVAAASLVRVDATRPDAELGCRCILRHAGGEFFVDAPGTVFPISFEDTGSGVFATAVAAIVLGLGPLGASSGRRLALAAGVCGLSALLVDIYLY